MGDNSTICLEENRQLDVRAERSGIHIFEPTGELLFRGAEQEGNEHKGYEQIGQIRCPRIQVGNHDRDPSSCSSLCSRSSLASPDDGWQIQMIHCENLRSSQVPR
jgi:hypothetical protein